MGTLLGYYARGTGYFLLFLFGFIILNDSALLQWVLMEKLWYGLFPLTGLVLGYIYGKGFSRRGGSLFAAAGFFLPLLALSYLGAAPFYGQLSNRVHIAAYFLAAAIGEAFFRTGTHLQAKRTLKTMANYAIIKSKRKKKQRDEDGDGEHSTEGSEW